MIGGSLEVKLPAIWADGKEVGRVREEKGRRKKSREEKESLKSRLVKRRVQIHLGR